MQDSTMGKTSFLIRAFAALLLAAACLFATGCASGNEGESPQAETVSPQSDQPENPTAENTVSVSILIDSSRVADEGYPENLASETLTLDKGSSVFDALKATGVAFDGSDSYITSIGGLSAMQYGENSGWLYKVNGKIPEVGAGDYMLEGGEEITWLYSLDFMKDFEAAA